LHTHIFLGEIADWPCQTSATHFPVTEHVYAPTWKI